MLTLLHLPYLPNDYWFSIFLKSEEVMIEQEENFVKSTDRNRCSIAGANGVLLLTIPIKGGRDTHRLYKETQIAMVDNWASRHWQSIRSAYGGAPFFEHYAPKLEPYFLRKEYTSLFAFNQELVLVILAMLKVTKPITYTDSYQPIYEGINDKRNLDFRQAASAVNFPRYYQLFETRNGFQPNLSIIDLIFHLGPQAKDYLLQLNTA
jgi:hypothetical protein